MRQQSLRPLQAQKSVRIGQSMDQPEKQREKIDQRQGRRMFDLPVFLPEVVDGRRHNGQGYQELDPPGWQVDMPRGAQTQRDRMADRKGRDQDHYFFPVFDQVAKTQGRHKKQVVERLPGEDMARAETEIKVELLHIVQVVKIIQTFVSRKFSF